MEVFPIEIHDGHAIFRHEGHVVLVDTGAPGTYHVSTPFPFMGRDHPANQNGGINIPSLRLMTGIPELTTLMGMDVIGRYHTLINYPDRKIIFSETPIDMPGEGLECDNYMSIPIIRVEIGGMPRRMYLDSGAKLGYLKSSHTRQLAPEGTEADFYPGFGRFETPVYRLQGSVAGMGFEGRYGNLPTALTRLLTMASTDGILGSDFFQSFRILLDRGTRQIKCWG